MANEDQARGKWDKTTGKIKEELGDAIGNEQMEYEGKWQQGEGHVREGVGNVREGLDETTEDIDDRR
ncbi:MAG: CsbD family protein [Chloroflexota bacterium]|nr:CsbD family protein [Chloroflexota bacterium]